MPIYKQTTEITKIDDVWTNIDRDIVEVYFGDKNIFTVWGEYDSTLPITISANGDALLDYRIYGADGGVGVATENLFDNRTRGYYNNDNGIFVNNSSRSYWKIPVQKGDIIYANDEDVMGYGCCFYQGEYVPNSRLRPSRFPYTVPDGVDEVTNNYPAGSRTAMVTVNRATPTEYVPYGYKLPMTVSDGNTEQTVPVYIGENQLAEDEYVDFGEQKVYKRTDNLFDGQGTDNFGYYDNANGRFIDDKNYKHWKFSVKEGDVIRWTATGVGWGCYWSKGVYRGRILRYDSPFTIPADVDEITNNFNSSVWDSAMVTKNQPLPADYVPYLQPTDPPVPLPEIPTIDGTTVIDYDGDPKPSQMYIKYRKQHS